MTTRPNILLVHGAWGDGSHWSHVIPSLHAKGYRVRAVQNPLTSLADDIDRTSKLAASLDGPTLMVGHSYGGSVITSAGRLRNVVGLVYVAGWAPDEGETLSGLLGLRAPPPGAAHAGREDDHTASRARIVGLATRRDRCADRARGRCCHVRTSPLCL